MDYHKYLIIGGGMTADAAARGIREIDSDGSIGIICAEAIGPYDRPPLSKAAMERKSTGQHLTQNRRNSQRDASLANDGGTA